MRLERAVRFGFTGMIGLAVIGVVTVWVATLADATVSVNLRGTDIRIVIMGLMGAAVALMFLFWLIGLFVDEKLEDNEIDRPDEVEDDGSNPLESDQSI